MRGESTALAKWIGIRPDYYHFPAQILIYLSVYRSRKSAKRRYWLVLWHLTIPLLCDHRCNDRVMNASIQNRALPSRRTSNSTTFCGAAAGSDCLRILQPSSAEGSGSDTDVLLGNVTGTVMCKTGVDISCL